MDDDGQIFRLNPDEHRARADAEQLYRSVSQRLVRLLPTGSEIMHIGATAIPGCLTKGNLDILVRVDSGDEFAEADRALASLFTRRLAATATVFSAFDDRGSVPQFSIQLVARGGEFDVFDKFRDRLIASPALLREYNALKREHDGAPMAKYQSAQDRFIMRALRY